MSDETTQAAPASTPAEVYEPHDRHGSALTDDASGEGTSMRQDIEQHVRDLETPIVADRGVAP